jgi:hypothetical protein
MAKEVMVVALRSKDLPSWRDSVVARDGTKLHGPSISIRSARLAFASAPDFSIAGSELVEVIRKPEGSTR